ncbi:MAG: NAD-dependent epimerase/dehydratase family protein [Candidatus Promineifilaceae bacterium]
MKALVIGGNGFIGSHLVDRLLACNWDVAVLDLSERRFDPMPDGAHFIRGDLNQRYLVREALAGVDVVYHLAWTLIHELSNQDPAEDIRANLIPTVHLLEACVQARAGRVVFVSSGGTVYGRTHEAPTAESHATDPLSSYGVTKLAAEKYLHMFHHLHGLEYAVLRPSTPYGPRQNPLGRQGAATIFLYKVASGLPVTIWGDGSVTRDYFYISDLIAAFMAAGTRPLAAERVFNIGGREEVSLTALLALVEETVGRKAQVEYRPARAFDAQRVALDTRLAEEAFGWRPEVELPEGLARTWAWLAEAVLA